MNNPVGHLASIKQEERKKRIMTVDDDEDVVFCLRAVLQETGLFDVDGYTDPQHALCSFKPGEYDLVILDIRMPKMNGFELYRKIKLIDKIVDICFLTGVYEFNEYRVVHPDITDEIEKNDDSCVIDKPADTEQLIKKINEVIGNRISKEGKTIEV
ncbi:MAG TPA: response regulator [Nitrososphaeraceae archaeon]|nr:response regulator [Nitrososphaeraceae archaeon]